MWTELDNFYDCLSDDVDDSRRSSCLIILKSWFQIGPKTDYAEFLMVLLTLKETVEVNSALQGLHCFKSHHDCSLLRVVRHCTDDDGKGFVV
jgi:hypothetical protein